MMFGRPTLLMLTAATAALAVIANGVSAASPPPAPADTRLGVSIKQDLAANDQKAAERGRALDMRERAASAMEARIKTDIAARQQAADTAKPANAAQPAAVGEQYDDLARIYQAMKPGKAALVFEQLDMDVQMLVAQRMRERSTAMILAAMTPKGAADLSMAIARKHAPGTKPSPPARP